MAGRQLHNPFDPLGVRRERIGARLFFDLQHIPISFGVWTRAFMQFLPITR